jgi:2-oxoglutarate ferredoxin oxidoreductase subunit alpha
LPTKTEQSDLMLAMFGRNGESPLPIVAAATPGDCFWMAQEAMRIAVEFMTPVILLSDGYIANGAEPWRIPDIADLTTISFKHPTEANSDDGYQPYLRDDRLVRPWAKAGTPGLMHRIGGLEKSDVTGNVDYDPDNHEHMSHIRAQKVANVAEAIPEQDVFGAPEGDVLVLSWGGTYGAVRQAVKKLTEDGRSVGHAHLKYLNPFPRNLADVLGRFKTVLVAELNLGQLVQLIRSRFLIDAQQYNKIQGKPFRVSELIEAVEAVL